MRKRLRLIALGALCCGQLACTASTSSVSVAAPAPAAADAGNVVWQLTVTVEGGIAGIAQRFSADSSSNSLVVTDTNRGTETVVVLAADEKRELSQSIASRASAPDIDLRSPGCNDCYHFEMTIGSGKSGKPRRVSYDAGAMEESPDTKLIDRVILIGRNGLAKKPR